MGSRGYLLVVLAASGCADGVYIEVQAPAGATAVELYFGTSACDPEELGAPCRAITPPDQPTGIPGTIFFRDSDARYTATVDDEGSAWFRLGPDTERVPVLVAVATAAEGTTPVGSSVVRDVAIDHTQQIVIELAAASSWADTGVIPGSVLQWSDGACVGTRPMAPADAGVIFVVPADDPDCDAGVTIRQCDPLVYQSSTQPERCLTPVSTLGTELCAMGQRSCSETDADLPDRSCVPTGPVLAPAFCKCVDDSNPVRCLADALVDPDALHVACTFFRTAAGMLCEDSTASVTAIDNEQLPLTALAVAPLHAYPFDEALFGATYTPPTPTTPSIKVMAGTASGTIQAVPGTLVQDPRESLLLRLDNGNAGPVQRRAILRLDVSYLLDPDCVQAPSCRLSQDL